MPGSVRHVTAYYNVRGCGHRGAASYRDWRERNRNFF
jgi:hypothetical protein